MSGRHEAIDSRVWDEVTRLRADNTTLRETANGYLQGNITLGAENAKLRSENAALRERVGKLETVRAAAAQCMFGDPDKLDLGEEWMTLYRALTACDPGTEVSK
jgi:hypothetical protein